MKSPTITAIAAISLDGKITPSQAKGSDWTSKEDKQQFYRELEKYDIFVVGKKTYQQYEKKLAQRNCIVFTRSIRRITEKSKKLSLFHGSPSSFKKYILQKKYRRVCVLGGAEIYTWFLKHKLLDEMVVTIEPIIFGKGVSLFRAGTQEELRIIRMKKIGGRGTTVLTVKRKKKVSSLE